jgi:hypothetical protein
VSAKQINAFPICYFSATTSGQYFVHNNSGHLSNIGELKLKQHHSLSDNSTADGTGLLPSKVVCRRDQKLLQKAADEVLTGSSVKGVAKSFNIPRSTLRGFMKRNGYVSPFDRKGHRRFT